MSVPRKETWHAPSGEIHLQGASVGVDRRCPGLADVGRRSMDPPQEIHKLGLTEGIGRRRRGRVAVR